MTRAEFGKAVKLAAWNRSGGRCEKCGAKLSTGNVEFHHDRECTFDGTADLQNCITLCRNCHSTITTERAPVIAKSNRIRNKHLGIAARRRQSFQTNRDAPFRKRMNGTVVRRP